MTMMRSDMPIISGSSEEIRMTASPSPASSPMKSCTAALEPTSMPLVGSSRMMILGLVASHLAITTFCWLPPESSPSGWSQLRRLDREARAEAARLVEFGAARQEAARADARERGAA